MTTQKKEKNQKSNRLYLLAKTYVIGLGCRKNISYIKLEKDMETKFITVLEILDRKIEIITRNIEEYNKLKQGLMQQLLTGKIRVKI